MGCASFFRVAYTHTVACQQILPRHIELSQRAEEMRDCMTEKLRNALESQWKLYVSFNWHVQRKVCEEHGSSQESRSNLFVYVHDWVYRNTTGFFLVWLDAQNTHNTKAQNHIYQLRSMASPCVHRNYMLFWTLYHGNLFDTTF